MKRISDEQLAQDLVCMKRVTCKRCRFEKDCIATFNIGLSASIQDYAHDLNEAANDLATDPEIEGEKMRVLVIDRTVEKAVIMETNVIPRIGDRIDLFYEPYPTVLGMLFWPQEHTLKPFKDLGFDLSNIDVVITIGDENAESHR